MRIIILFLALIWISPLPVIGGWTEEWVAAGGEYPVMVLDALENPHIFYRNKAGNHWRHAWKADGTWHSGSFPVIHSPQDPITAMTDRCGCIHLAWIDRSSAGNPVLMHMVQNGTVWQTETVITTGDLGWNVADFQMDVAPNGSPVFLIPGDGLALVMRAPQGWSVHRLIENVEISHADLAAGGDGHLHLVFTRDGPDGEIFTYGEFINDHAQYHVLFENITNPYYSVDEGRGASIFVDMNDNPWIIHFHRDGELVWLGRIPFWLFDSHFVRHHRINGVWSTTEYPETVGIDFLYHKSTLSTISEQSIVMENVFMVFNFAVNIQILNGDGSFSTIPRVYDRTTSGGLVSSNSQDLHLACQGKSDDIIYRRYQPDVFYRISVDDPFLSAGDTLAIHRRIRNETPNPVDCLETVILETAGSIWFYPDWTPNPASHALTVPDSSDADTVLLSLTWPDLGNWTGRFTFWGALVESGTGALLGLSKAPCHTAPGIGFN